MLPNPRGQSAGLKHVLIVSANFLQVHWSWRPTFFFRCSRRFSNRRVSSSPYKRTPHVKNLMPSSIRRPPHASYTLSLHFIEFPNVLISAPPRRLPRRGLSRGRERSYRSDCGRKLYRIRGSTGDHPPKALEYSQPAAPVWLKSER